MRFSSRWLPATAFAAVFLTLSCGGSDGPTGPDPNAVATVSVTPATLSLDIGDMGQLSAQALNSEGGTVSTTVTWSSSATGVATVSSSGQVSAVGEGSTTITASADGQSGTATVTVTDPSPPAPPSGLQAITTSHTQVELSWTDGSDNEIGFEIERETIVAGTPGEEMVLQFEAAGTVGADVTAFTDDGLSPTTDYRYRVRAVNANGESDYSEAADASTFAPLALETTSLPAATLEEPYQAALSASGGDGSFAWSLLSGEPPAGIELSGEGVLSGTPTETGSFELEIEVSGGGQTATATLTLSVLEELTPPTVVTTELPGALVGEAYSAALEAQGGDGTFTWSLDSGSLPQGLSLADDGTVSGTPTVVGTATVTVEVSSAGLSGTGEVSIAVAENPLTITTGALPDAQVETAYQATLEAEGGLGAQSWSVSGGTLPTGLDLSSDGVLSGTPQEAGSFDLTVQVTTADDAQTATADLSLAVTPGPVTILSRVVASGAVGTSYSTSLRARGGDGVNYEWTILGGAFPAGLQLSPDGIVQGTPTTVGEQNVTVRATSGGQTDFVPLRVTVRPGARVGYQIDLVYLTTVTGPQRAAFENAQARWSELITEDIEDQVGGIPACATFHPGTEGTVDDLVIYVRVDSIDGAGGTLGQAGWCFARDNYLTLTGAMTFDEADLASLESNDLLEPVILHEMGHVLGVGSTWEQLDLRTRSCTEEPIFVGEGAIDAFLAADGDLYSGEPVPIEDQGDPGDGTNCSHWRESVMGSELMTGFINLGDNPLSAVTTESLGDQGYIVDGTLSDSYVLPKPVPAGQARARAFGVWLHDDLLPTPKFLVLPGGRIQPVGRSR